MSHVITTTRTTTYEFNEAGQVVREVVETVEKVEDAGEPK